MANSMAIMVSFFFPQALVDWDLSDAQTATVTAMLFFGTFVGVFCLQFVAFQLGRRSTFLLFSFLTALFGCLGAAAPNFPVMLCLRFATGFGLAGTGAGFYSLGTCLCWRYF